ncbi:MAG: DsbC family protein [Methyloversatilis sp.]|jgi:thiol:disulfide interchange protein DsbC|uniref:Thiol:disulfide interchange protein n=1 Tax=Methyloversatilis universalis (strain ATCC BAA-1314 / DSM 25237 / JCM 13912 / CCUG 52030 / FAM5) TaxID=1000565 RepID=F5RH75_METUF|nr:DsbC family protein [Methyloversatilis universalis]EGK70279.1 Putative thiol:disulfide interchange protein DsbC precursor [Methyloversatilis universalis FAM5]MCP4634846.1 DsbC family protein [Methyloversatilis sp.]
MFIKHTAALLCALSASLAWANPEDTIRSTVEATLGAGAKVEGVTKTPYLGLYEVRVGGEILYTDEKASYLIIGEILDPKTRQNITQARVNQLSAINFAELPLDVAIKQVRGNGKRVIATFEDPNCGYCKKLAKELLTLNDVTIYTFLTPVLGPDSQKKSEAIWCAADRQKAWGDWMTANVQPPAAAASCDTAGLKKSVALGEKYRVRGTPTIFLSNGERIPGYVPVAQLEKRIAGVK